MIAVYPAVRLVKLLKWYIVPLNIPKMYKEFQGIYVSRIPIKDLPNNIQIIYPPKSSEPRLFSSNSQTGSLLSASLQHSYNFTSLQCCIHCRSLCKKLIISLMRDTLQKVGKQRHSTIIKIPLLIVQSTTVLLFPYYTAQKNIACTSQAFKFPVLCVLLQIQIPPINNIKKK